MYKNAKNSLLWYVSLLLFPQSDIRTKLETMSPGELMAVAHRPLDSLPHNIFSLFSYEDKIIQEAIWAIKYDGSRSVAQLLGSTLYDMLVDTLSDEFLFSHFSNALLIPIPLSRQRLKERGWNQSEMLVFEIEKRDKGRLFTVARDILIKTKHTLSQTSLQRSERLSNLKGCFKVKEKYKDIIKNQNIILIDDVTTTGSTLTEAMMTLYKSGVRKVLAFTVAH